MKRFKILCVSLMTIFIVGVLCESVSDFLSGIRLGGALATKAVKQQIIATDHLCLDVNERISDYIPNSINTLTGDSVLVLSRNISVIEFHRDSDAVDHPLKNHYQSVISTILNLLVIIVYTYIVVLFIKVVVSFSRSQIFETRIISRLNRIGVLFIILGLVSTADQIVRINIACAAVRLPDYIFTYQKSISWDHFVIGLVVLVMTEILRQATTIKEDHDLTI